VEASAISGELGQKSQGVVKFKSNVISIVYGQNKSR
jgi:hypothetical protein